MGPETALDERVQIQLNQYLATLLLWNARMNLTSIREPREIVRHHFGESLFAARMLPKSLKTLLDFGSGAGFPGLPIQILRPEIEVTLAESNAKKVAFLREITRKSDLKAHIFAGRVEAMEAGTRFDAVTMRAVERMAEALPLAAGRVAPGGMLLVMTTQKDEEAFAGVVSGFSWQTPVPVPESESRVVLIGIRD